MAPRGSCSGFLAPGPSPMRGLLSPGSLTGSPAGSRAGPSHWLDPHSTFSSAPSLRSPPKCIIWGCLGRGWAEGSAAACGSAAEWLDTLFSSTLMWVLVGSSTVQHRLHSTCRAAAQGDACREPHTVLTNGGDVNDPFSSATDFDLADYFDTTLETTTKPAKPTPKPFPRPGKPAKDPLDFDLADALDDKNDGKDAGRPDVRPGEGFSDDDLASIVDGGYSPDKKKGAGGSTDSDYDGGRVAETGTIAGIASALAMALIGAVSSYISYQQKKFCFSIQQGLNAEYVKGENMEAVVSEEPQVKYSVPETQSAEPPKQDSAKM
uniref:CD99 antigen-like protein 2 n=1 Tax=Falco tinnunculus TaxID=100819 RepID=A0A8C4U1D9_FALTI